MPSPRRAARLLAVALAGAALGACGGSLYDAAGVPLLDGGQQCGADQHLCAATGNVCQAQDAGHCGDACDVCPDPGNGGVPACVKGAGATWSCGFACQAPTRQCGGQCLAESVSACGPSCQDCAALAPAGTVPACVPGAGGNECAYACQAGWFACGAPSGCCQPVAVSAGGDQACAVLTDGSLRCWGANGSGQLGQPVPGGPLSRLVAGMASGVTGVAVGASHACAIRDGTVFCWGADDLGQLGDGDAVSSGPTPVSTGLAGATQLVAGSDHTCALVAGGVRCWGANNLGQLGIGTSGPGARATAPPAAGIAGLSGVTQLAAGGDTTCALAAGTVRCWGANGSGQAGSGDVISPQASPVGVSLPAAATTLGVGAAHTCAGVTGHGLLCWGANEAGQLGTGTASATPATAAVAAVRIDNGTGALLVAGGAGFTCGAKDATELICNGRNDQGQSGVADMTANALDRVAVGLGGGALLTVAAGKAHACALVDAGASGKQVRCWGRNAEGQLGRDTQGLPSADAALTPPAP